MIELFLRRVGGFGSLLKLGMGKWTLCCYCIVTYQDDKSL